MGASANAQKIKLNNQSRWGFDSERLGWVEIKERINNGGEFSEGLASVRIGKKWGFIDTLGALKIPAQFDEVKEFHNGFAAARQGKLWGIIDPDGTPVIPFEYDMTEGFYDGLALVKKDGKYGYINADNTLVIGYNFCDASNFYNGLAAARDDEKGKYGYIDRTGNFKIPRSYDDAQAFVDGIAQVKAQGKKFFIDMQGTYYKNREDAMLAAEDLLRREHAQRVANSASSVVNGMPVWAEGGVAQGIPPEPDVTRETLREYMIRCGIDNSDLAPIVARKLKEWQKKGNYETASAYEMRVTPEGIENKRKELYLEYEGKYNNYTRPYLQAFRDAKKRDFLNPGNVFTLEEYDDEAQRYRIHSTRLGDIYLAVPRHKADLFKERWTRILTGLNCVYVPYGDDLRLSELDFAGYKYEFELPAEPQLDDLLAHDDNVTSAKGSEEEVMPEAVEIFISDVDRNIPEGINPDASRTYAIIIGNEHYSESDCSDVPYAINDATSFKEYCERALGINPKNIYFRTDATLNNMRRGVSWFRKISDAFEGDVKLLVYYAGHGIPNEDGSDSYLLPADGIPGDPESAYRLGKFYNELGEIPAKNTTVFLDACFSGTKRSGGMLTSARAVAIEVPEVEPKGNMVVFSAASGEETAMPYNDQHHGLFTYFLLKKLQQTGGNTTYRELFDYLNRNVRQLSLTENQKVQTPTVNVAYDMDLTWEGLVLNSEGVGVASAGAVTYSPETPAPSPAAPTQSISAAAVSAAIEGSTPRSEDGQVGVTTAEPSTVELTVADPDPVAVPVTEPAPAVVPVAEPVNVSVTETASEPVVDIAKGMTEAEPVMEVISETEEIPVESATPAHISAAILNAAIEGASPQAQPEEEPEIQLPLRPRPETEPEPEITLPISPID